MLTRLTIALLLALPIGCANHVTTTDPAPSPSPNTAIKLEAGDAPQIEVASSPEAGAEALVLKAINSSMRYIRLAGYSFTSPAVVKALLAAKRRGVDVKVLIDDKGNRGTANIAAMNLITGAEIPLRVISSYAIFHDKYIVVDGRHTQTGSFNFSQAAASSNSENVIVIWNNPAVAGQYFKQWESRWAKGTAVEQRY